MNGATTRWLSRGLVALALALVILATVVRQLPGNRLETSALFSWAITLVFSVAGYVITTRTTGNPIGWLFLGVGVSAAVGTTAGAYATYWVETGHGSDGLGEAAAAYGSISWIPFILVPATFLLLLFPDGHLLSSRWRPVAWVAAAGIAGTFLGGALTQGPLEDYPEIDNPFGVDHPAVEAVAGLSLMVTGVAIVFSAASVVLRFRRARGVERLQMKWIAFAAAVAAVTLVVMTITYEDVGETIANAAMMTAVLGLPAATAVAIGRYRLYDIDVVINRALVYGSLTAILAAAYAGSVLVLQVALSGLTQDSGLAVAASTLGVAALFRPVRSRIQGYVDRRFFRSRYDAAQTLQAFGSRLRDEVDLDVLRTDLQLVVRETMRPAHVSLWLRPQERS